jgi:hypothetical protein
MIKLANAAINALLIPLHEPWIEEKAIYLGALMWKRYVLIVSKTCMRTLLPQQDKVRGQLYLKFDMEIACLQRKNKNSAY